MLTDLVEFLLGVVNNNKFYSIKFKDPLVLEINKDLELSIPPVVTSSIVRSGTDNGSRWDVRHGLQVSLNDTGIIKQEMGLLKFDEFKKDVGLLSGGQLHKSQVGLHNKSLFDLVVKSDFPHFLTKHVHWAW